MKFLEGRTEIQKRWITGVFGVVLFVSLLVYGGAFGAFLIASVLSLGMADEYARMGFQMVDRAIKRNALMIAAWLSLIFVSLLGDAEGHWLILTFTGLFSFFLYLLRFHDAADFREHFKEFGIFFVGVFYSGVMPSYLLKIQQVNNGVSWLLLFFFIVWGTDTGAYFAGKKFGGPKLYEKVSPKKTRSGAIGGIGTAYLVTIIFKFFFLREMSWFFVVLAPGIVSVLAQVGDFCESFIKRAFAVKDSGSILPGHGGFLDRFDGVVFGLPFMYACMKILSSV